MWDHLGTRESACRTQQRFCVTRLHKSMGGKKKGERASVINDDVCVAAGVYRVKTCV